MWISLPAGRGSRCGWSGHHPHQKLGRRACVMRADGERGPARGAKIGKKGRPGAGGYLSREPRIAVRYEAVLIEADGCELDVVVTDVSRDGFRLESHSEL